MIVTRQRKPRAIGMSVMPDPNLIDPLNGNPAEHVGVDLGGWHRLARVRLGPRKVGEPHEALVPFAADDMALGRQ